MDSYEEMSALLRRIDTGVVTVVRSISADRRQGSGSGRWTPRRAATVKVRSKMTMLEIVSSFIRVHFDALTKYRSDQSRWEVENVCGECVGKLQKEPLVGYRYAPEWSLIVWRIRLRSYALGIGVSESHFKQLLDNPRIRAKRLFLVKEGPAKNVYVIPLGRELICTPKELATIENIEEIRRVTG
jgi:hypothetical protein